MLVWVICTHATNTTNPNTAMSGASDYYIHFSDQTEGAVVLSNPEIYDAIGEDFTLEIWVRKTTGSGCYRPIIAKHPQTPGTITNNDNGLCEYLLEVQYNDAVNFLSGCGSYVKYGYYVAVDQIYNYPELHAYIIQQNRWTHLAVSVDWRQDVTGIPTGVAKVYADGVLVDAALWAASSPSCNGKKRLRQPGVPIRLGYFDNQDPGFQYWVGDMDELRIWSVARTAEQIKNYYSGGVPIDSPGLVSYHTFSEGCGLYSCNTVLDSCGYPRVQFTTPMWAPSDLKLTPNTAVTTQGYSVTGQPVGTPGVDLYLTKFVMNTNAYFLFSDGRDPRQRNIRRQITSADLPLNVGPVSVSNILKYVAGDIAGIDYVYYEARNNASYPEPSGPSYLVFETVCLNFTRPDTCRVCRTNSTRRQGDLFQLRDVEEHENKLGNYIGKNFVESSDPGVPVIIQCPQSCDGEGGIYDLCGVCNGDSQSCRGCDGIPFSNAVFDICGICNGDGSSCSLSEGPCTNGTIDSCGMCNGTNA